MESTMEREEVSTSEVSKRIYTLRGCRVMLDRDLAEIYEVETKVLKQSVKRNLERFPHDFMFEPTQEEKENLRSQIVTSSSKNCSEAHVKPILRSQNDTSKVDNCSEVQVGVCLRSKFVTSSVENSHEDHARPNLRSKIWISSLEKDSKSHGGSRYTPFAFTELGVAMLSSVLNSPQAIQVNIGIMRIFVELRQEPRTHQQPDLTPKFESLATGLDVLKQRVDSIEHKIEKQSNTALSVAAKDPVGIIQNAVARRWGLRVEDLKSATRKKSVSIPRQIAIYLVRKHLCMGLSEIGQHFGRRDHSTILHAYRRVYDDCGTNHVIRKTIDSLQNELQPLLS
jgi:hypothetical protein